jgi:hypothetical protein
MTDEEMEKPYILKLKGVNYIMFDSSYGQDDQTSDAHQYQHFLLKFLYHARKVRRHVFVC